MTAITPPATVQGHVNAGEGSNTARGDPDGPDFGELAIQQTGLQRAGGSAVQNNTAAYGVLSPTAAAQYNAIQNSYFAPLEQQYGITPDQLTQLFQSNAISPADQDKLLSGFNDVYNNTINPDQWYDKLFAQLALGTTVGVATAGLGTALTPALGAIGAAAASGAAGGALSSALTGQNAAKGALVGAATGGAGAAANPLIQQLVAQGVNPAVAAALVKGGLGAGTGALGAAVTGGSIGQAAAVGGVSGAIKGGLQASGVNSVASGALTGAARGALSGQGALQGAEGGALNGAINSATGAVSNSIFNSGNTIFSSGGAANPTNNPQYTTPEAPGVMALDSQTYDDDPYSFLNYDQGPSNYVEDPGAQTAFDPSILNNIDPSLLGSLQFPDDPGQGPGLNIQGGGTTLTGPNVSLGGGSGGSSSNPLAALASLLGGSGGSNNALLAQLLGLGTSAIGGSLQSDAAKSAAGTFAGQTAFNPYSVSTNSGNTSFNGTNASSSLSPGQQQTSNALTGLGQSSIASLNGGTAGAANDYFNNLQANQQSANQRFMAGTQDNEFANGVLGSTAGQYQTQAALGALGQQTTQNQTTANNFANTQQQNQLANLTASLNGNNQINQGQLAQAQLGAGIGSQASTANIGAYSPSLAANSNNNIGNLLSTLGQTQNSGSSNQNALLQYLTQNGH